MIEVCKVVPLNDRPVTPVDYSAKKFPCGPVMEQVLVIIDPMQSVIDDTTQNIFVADFGAERIQVFNGEGNHLNQITTPPRPTGLDLTDEYIFVSTPARLDIMYVMFGGLTSPFHLHVFKKEN